MNKKVFQNLIKDAILIGKRFQHIGKRFQSIRYEKSNLIVFSFLFIIVAALAFSYDSSVKKKRSEQINFFISNNQTVLLKNYLLNQIKSPYLEYDYVVQNNDTVESILKKFSVKQSEINFIVTKIKKMSLSNIIPGQKVQFVLKKGKDKKNMEIV